MFQYTPEFVMLSAYATIPSLRNMNEVFPIELKPEVQIYHHLMVFTTNNHAGEFSYMSLTYI
jgi:hypothetical protein